MEACATLWPLIVANGSDTAENTEDTWKRSSLKATSGHLDADILGNSPNRESETFQKIVLAAVKATEML
jgi:hypothetical protein